MASLAYRLEGTDIAQKVAEALGAIVLLMFLMSVLHGATWLMLRFAELLAPAFGKRKQRAPEVVANNQAAEPTPTFLCPICLERVPESDAMHAGGGSGVGSTSSRPAGCGHLVCNECMGQYVQDRIQARTYPVPCPRPHCQQLLTHDNVDALLEQSPDDLKIFTQMEVEHAVGGDHTYCPYKDCSAFLAMPDHVELDVPTICPACERELCLTCRIQGWHEGFTCQAFQSLPAHLRTEEDAATLMLSAAKKWKQCPHCANMVELAVGCNHIRCRCGTSFCYACGTKYESQRPTAANVHGTQGCKCALFTVPAEPQVRVRAARAARAV